MIFESAHKSNLSVRNNNNNKSRSINECLRVNTVILFLSKWLRKNIQLALNRSSNQKEIGYELTMKMFDLFIKIQ